MKCPSEMLQNLLYFWNTKTHIVCRHRPGQWAFIRQKNKVAQNEKQKKLSGFLYSKNMANFELFQ